MRNEPQREDAQGHEHGDVLAVAAVVGVGVAIVADFLVVVAIGHGESSGEPLTRDYLEQVQQRKQENPHEIDEVPIQADVFDEASLAAIERDEQQQDEYNQPHSTCRA